MLKSKSVQLEDYAELQPGLAAAYYANGICQGAGVRIELPHAHRMWEYASALTALEDLRSKERILDVGSGHTLLGPAAQFRHGSHLTEVEPLDSVRQEREEVLTTLLDGDYKFIPSAIPFETDETYDAVFAISVVEHIQPALLERSWRWLARRVAPGGLLVATVDYGDGEVRNPQDREVLFYRSDLEHTAKVLEEEGISFGDIDFWLHEKNVFDYTFFRFVGRRA